MSSPVIRWLQRLDNYKRAHAQLRKAAILAGERPLSELEQQGLIQLTVEASLPVRRRRTRRCAKKMIQSYIPMILAGMMACGLSACANENAGDALDALEGRPVSVVQIRYRGERVIDEVRLDNFIATKPGDRFTREAIDADVKSLYESGMVNEVRFLAEPDGGSVRLIAEVSTRTPYGPPFCIGNSAFSDKRLADAIGFTRNRPITIASLEIARKKLRDYYVTHGYANAKVKCRAFNGGDSSPEDYVFVVDEGSPTPQSASKNEAQQAGTVQPATCSQSKLGGNYKPRPETESRSR